MLTICGRKMETIPVKVSVATVLLWGMMGDMKAVAVACIL